MSDTNPHPPGESPEKKYRKALASVLDCLIVMDAEGQVVLANDRAVAKMGVADIKRLALPQIVELFKNHVQDSGEFQRQMASLRNMSPLAAELVFPLASSVGNLRVYSMPVVQVQSPRKPEEAKAAARTEEEELEHLKKEFLSTISHELRTPLTAIKGALGLALGGTAGPLSPELRELLELAEKNTDRLIGLITSILDMFKLETRRLPMRMEPFSLAESIQHKVSSHRPATEKKKLALETQIEPGLPRANGDRARLEQALDQLLSNAIKFSPPEATVTVAARHVAENGQAFVEVSVRDRGKGIPPEAQKRIFSKFSLAEDTLTREHQGSGLGLAIARAIVEGHGGRIWFESQVGEGSTFFFTVPASPAPVEARPAEQAAETAEQKKLPLVLVVDDDQDVGRIVCGIFTANGYRACSVDRGEEAVEMAERHQPDLIALDLFMPGMSGFEVLHLLKENDHTRSIPVICMSVVDDPGRAIALGAEKFVSKPIDVRALVEIAGSVLRRQPPAPPALDKKAMGIRKVLLAEDEEDIQKVARMSLQFQGHWEVVVAGNGQECLEKVSTEHPDLILLDAMMPRMDGYETCRRLKADPATRHIPVIFLTAKAQEAEIKKGLELGAVGYLVKPFDPMRLAAQIQQILENVRGEK